MGTPKNDFGVPLIASVPRTGTEMIATTHNFCDPSTWYTTSTREIDKALTDSGDGLTWTSGDVWVDMTHGKVFDEDALCADVPHGYAVEVKVGGAIKTERVPFAASGGDFVVDYRNGTITFASSQAGSVVMASYSKMVDSVYVLAPVEGYRLDIEQVEVQFSSDVQMNAAAVFEVWAYNPYDLPNKVPVAVTRYKTIRNFVDEALGSYPVVPAMGGLRGFQYPIYGFPFRYGTIRSMLSSAGLELRVRMENDVACSGEHALATFYTTITLEDG